MASGNQLSRVGLKRMVDWLRLQLEKDKTERQTYKQLPLCISDTHHIKLCEDVRAGGVNILVWCALRALKPTWRVDTPNSSVA